jgi:hypothetical protein
VRATYSHRDRRLDRSIRRLLVVALIVVLALSAIAALEVSPVFGALVVLLLGSVGGAMYIHGQKLVTDYSQDLARVNEGDGADPTLTVEVRNTAELEPAPAAPPTPLPRGRRTGRRSRRDERER